MKVTGRFVLAAGCPAVNGKYISYLNKKQNRTQHNLTAPTEDVFELTTRSRMTLDLSDLATDNRLVQCT